MALDLTQARRMLQRYMEAEEAVLDGQTINFGGRSMTMADLAKIRSGRQEWERKVKALEGAAVGGGSSYKLATFD